MMVNKINFYLWFIFQLILYFLTFPFKFLITFIAYFIWKPPFEFDKSLFQDNGLDKTFPIKLTKSCDSAKFEGILSAVKNDKKMLMKFLDDNYEWTRFYDKCSKNFSGDMISGWLYGFVNLYYNRELNAYDILRFKTAVEKMIFNKPYFQFKNKKVKEYDRGFVFRWWFFGFDFIVPLAILHVYNSLFKNKQIKFIYYILLFISYPLLYLYPNPSIVNDKWYWISWYSIHSKTLLARTMLMMGKSKIAEKILKFSYSRYGRINPEICALYCDYFGWTDEDKEFVEIWLKDYTDKKEALNRIEFMKLKNIKRTLKNLFKRQKYDDYIVISKKILPTRYLSNEYLWEKSLLEPSNKHDPFIAYYHLRYLYEKSLF